MRVWPGSFRYVAKNLFTVVGVINPTSLHDLEIAAALDTLIYQSVPMR